VRRVLRSERQTGQSVSHYVTHWGRHKLITFLYQVYAVLLYIQGLITVYYIYICIYVQHIHNSEVPDNRQYRTTIPLLIRSYIHYLTCPHVIISTAVGNCSSKQVQYYLNRYMLHPRRIVNYISPVSLLGWILPTKMISWTPKMGCCMGNTCNWIRF